MKLLIASDIHGAAGYCRQLLDAWDREGADRLLLLGDVLYHGPRNDLPPDYAPICSCRWNFGSWMYGCVALGRESVAKTPCKRRYCTDICTLFGN